MIASGLRISEASKVTVAEGDFEPRRETSESDGVFRIVEIFTAKSDCLLVQALDRAVVTWKNPSQVITPALAPNDDDVIGDHAFRTPMVIVGGDDGASAIVADVNVIACQPELFGDDRDHPPIDDSATSCAHRLKMIMDVDASGDETRVTVGLADYVCRPHVYYQRTGKPTKIAKGTEVRFGFYVLEAENIVSALRKASEFCWTTFGAAFVESNERQALPYSEYAELSAQAVLNVGEWWEDATRGGFLRAGKGQVEDAMEEYFQVPSRSVWFHAWFNSLRTAFGMRCHARSRGDGEWVKRMDKVKELVLNAPDPLGTGLLPAVFDTVNDEWWNGVPRLGVDADAFDLTSSAHTGQWMRRWNRRLDGDDRLTARCDRLRDYFISIQDDDGGFPGYVGTNGAPLNLLRGEAHGAMIPLFLCECHEDSPDGGALDAIVKACDFFIRDVVPERRFHDFELFFSCSPKPLDFYDHRTNQHGQNNLSLFWITDTLLRTYEFTRMSSYLEQGLYCLDLLSMYQQVWNPPYISLRTFGGFGVMNTDGEWNDTRQVFFSEAYDRAARLTGSDEWRQRGDAALRAGRALLCHPDHASLNPLRYDTFEFGLAPENYAHTGQNGRAIRSGFDWGGGAFAAMTAWRDVSSV